MSALATEFEGDGRQALAGLGHHGLAGGDATGQDDAVHTGVAGQRIADEAARAGDDLKHARGQPGLGLVDGLGPRKERERRP